MIRFEHGALALLLACALGCSDSDDPAADEGQGGGGGGPPAVSFAEHIHPIFLAKCAGSGCHSVANPVQPGHAAVDSAVAYAEATRLNLMGEPMYERILARTNSPEAATMMPPPYAPSTPTKPACQGALGQPGCLTQAEFDLIQDWVDQGRPQ